MQVGRAIDKKDVNGDGKEGEESEEGGTLQPLSRNEILVYGYP